MSINEKLFFLLEEKKLKQSDLAKYLGVSQAVITTWKNRKTDPPASKLINICKFLEISVYELLGEEPNNQLELIYSKLDPKDKEIVDNIFSRYKYQEQKSSDSKIG